MARQDEDIELVLGNKQLLSLFFVVVLFFAAFFSVGYTVGFGHGEASGPAPTLANADSPTPEKQDEPSFPQSLYKEAPAMPPAAPAKQSPTEAVERAVPGRPKLSEDKPEQKPAADKPKPTMAKATPPPNPQPATAEEVRAGQDRGRQEGRTGRGRRIPPAGCSLARPERCRDAGRRPEREGLSGGGPVRAVGRLEPGDGRALPERRSGEGFS